MNLELIGNKMISGIIHLFGYSASRCTILHTFEFLNSVPGLGDVAQWESTCTRPAFKNNNNTPKNFYFLPNNIAALQVLIFSPRQGDT
jgi:hypothetical protein